MSTGDATCLEISGGTIDTQPRDRIAARAAAHNELHALTLALGAFLDSPHIAAMTAIRTIEDARAAADRMEAIAQAAHLLKSAIDVIAGRADITAEKIRAALRMPR